MSDQFDVYGIGHALVDLQYTVSKDTLQALGVDKGVMTLIDQTRQAELLEALASESANSASGGSAANTAIAVSKFGGSAFYACQVGDDDWGRFYREDLERAGVGTSPDCRTPGKTGQCIVFVTPDADRTLNTFLGASSGMGPERVSEVTIKSSRFIYLEGYLLTSELGLKACRKAQEIARQSGTGASGMRRKSAPEDPNITTPASIVRFACCELARGSVAPPASVPTSTRPLSE